MSRSTAAVLPSDRWAERVAPRAHGRQPRVRMWAREADTGTAIAIVALCCVAVVYATGVLHWALIPIAACGILQAPLVVRWLRGGVDAFDPRSLVALLLLHNTFVAPLLHLSWDWYTSLVVVPPDPWLWFGRLALVNVVSLLALEVAYRAVRSSAGVHKPRRLARGRFRFALAIAALVAVAAQGYVLSLLGGFGGIVDAYEAGGQDLTGTGWAQMLAWPLFLIVLLAWITMRRRPQPAKQTTIVAVLVLFAVAHFAWVGLQGSRSSTLAGLLLAAAYCHFLVRRFTVRSLLAIGMAAVAFAFVYGFYKAGGRAGLSDALSGDGNFAFTQQQTGRNLPVLLLADLARADIQMEVLWTMYDGNPDYQLKLGSTYLSAAVFIPRAIWPTRPYGTQEAYAELTRGSIAVGAGERPGSRVFGLTGETLLNFGWLGVPFVHALFGLLIGLMSRVLYSLKPQDGRMLLVPLAMLMIVTIYPSDLVNVVYAFFRDGLVLTACAVWGIGRTVQPAVRHQ